MDRETAREAIAAAFFAVLTWVGLWLIGALLTVYYARAAERRIEAHPNLLKGSELAGAARSVASIGVVAGLVVVLLIFVATL
jgi:hypothetical protein